MPKKTFRHRTAAGLAGIFLLALSAPPQAGSSTQGGLRYSVMVQEFENQGDCDDSLGFAWKTQLSTALAESGRFLVVSDDEMQLYVGKEQLKGASGLTTQGRKTPVRGQMTGTQLLIKGVITECKQGAADQGGGLNLGQFRIGAGRARTDIRANLQMIDTSTARIVSAKAFTATAQKRKLNIGGGKSSGSGDATFGEDDKTQEALDKAIRAVIPWLEAQLSTVEWRGSILKVRDDGVVLVNRGAQEGVSPGQVFVAGESETLRDPDTGDVLHEELTERARLQVERVENRIAFCKVIGGDGNLLIQGMAVAPAS